MLLHVHDAVWVNSLHLLDLFEELHFADAAFQVRLIKALCHLDRDKSSCLVISALDDLTKCAPAELTNDFVAIRNVVSFYQLIKSIAWVKSVLAGVRSPHKAALAIASLVTAAAGHPSLSCQFSDVFRFRGSEIIHDCVAQDFAALIRRKQRLAICVKYYVSRICRQLDLQSIATQHVQVGFRWLV